jgi:predicted signal transduction protein with EAL and GGDEF domain
MQRHETPQRGKAATKAAVEPVAGCRLKVAGWLPTRSVNLQPATCNLQLRRSLRTIWTIAVQSTFALRRIDMAHSIIQAHLRPF